jgi:hypothetical protein
MVCTYVVQNLAVQHRATRTWCPEYGIAPPM